MTEAVVSAFATSVAAAMTQGWRKVGKLPERFPSIVAEALECGISRFPFTAADIVEWVWNSEVLPHQPRLDETFGQPPITLYCNDEFRIDALFWVDSNTAVHAHAFSGAFLVLDGHSVHSRFTFTEHQRIGRHFILGHVEAMSAELLDPGDVREIRAGAESIHSVIHLGNPSVTIVARTSGKCAQPSEPEYAYFPPAVALDPSRTNSLRTRRVQLVRMVIRTAGGEGLLSRLDRLFARCDLHTAFLVLLEVGRHLSTSALVSDVLDLCDRNWPGVAEPFAATVVAAVRHDRAAQLLHKQVDPSYRLVLGALAALDEPRRIHELLSSVTASPEKLIEDCIHHLQSSGSVTHSNSNPYDHLLFSPLARPR